MAQLSISEVRRELLRGAGPGQPSTALAGAIFHQVVAGLLGPQGWPAALEAGELADARRLATHAYEQFLGRRLTDSQAGLRENGAEVLALWEATQGFCTWLSRLLDTAAQRGLIRYDKKLRAWTGAEQLFRPEQSLQWEVRDPHWTAPVVVSGIADALVKNPDSGRWCVLEFKLGQGRPEADLAQACLYHSMLTANGLTSGDGALALLSFAPGLQEEFYASPTLQEAQGKLRELIGRLGGVLAPAYAPVIAVPSEQHIALGQRLVAALETYGIFVEWKNELSAGPRFLRYFVMPARGVTVKQVVSKAEDVQLRLELERPPMIHNASGRLVIDVQRPDPQTVSFASILDQIPVSGIAGCSRAPLGVDLNGTLQFVDLSSSNTPHLLVAGTSGSGKSEWLRSAVAGLLYSNTPDTLRLVLIDPKRSAFPELKGSPFLVAPKGLLYPPEDSPIEVLDTLVEEMEKRYKLFSQAFVSDLAEYAAKTGQILPRLVCVCDEYADLLSDRKTRAAIEWRISRLGAKARAAGVHLIIATQYPNRETVGGALKMNLAGRVCLRVTTSVQSYMVINQGGAEHLLGNGDLFFLSVGDPVRLQSPLLLPEERARIFAA